ncbi:hypothetical protein HK102_009835, partial [Quaeritorhiza haematococci]
KTKPRFSYPEVCRGVGGVFATISDKYPIDKVLIECQPSKNKQMCMVSSMIMSWFIFQGIADVRFVSAKTKLAAVGTGPGTGPGTPKKLTYRDRKQLSVKETQRMLTTEGSLIENGSEAHEWLSRHSKKDDLCEALLQAVNVLKLV